METMGWSVHCRLQYPHWVFFWEPVAELHMSLRALCSSPFCSPALSVGLTILIASTLLIFKDALVSQ